MASRPKWGYTPRNGAGGAGPWLQVSPTALPTQARHPRPLQTEQAAWPWAGGHLQGSTRLNHPGNAAPRNPAPAPDHDGTPPGWPAVTSALALVTWLALLLLALGWVAIRSLS